MVKIKVTFTPNNISESNPPESLNAPILESDLETMVAALKAFDFSKKEPSLFYSEPLPKSEMTSANPPRKIKVAVRFQDRTSNQTEIFKDFSGLFTGEPSPQSLTTSEETPQSPSVLSKKRPFTNLMEEENDAPPPLFFLTEEGKVNEAN